MEKIMTMMMLMMREDAAMMQIVHPGWVGPLEALTAPDRNY